MESRRFAVVKALAERLGYAGLAAVEVEAIHYRPAPERLLRRLSVVDEPGSPIHLTARQREAMVLLSSGLSRQEIAGEMGVGYETVKRHLKLAYIALGARNKVEAVNAFIERAA